MKTLILLLCLLPASGLACDTAGGVWIVDAPNGQGTTDTFYDGAALLEPEDIRYNTLTLPSIIFKEIDQTDQITEIRVDDNVLMKLVKGRWTLEAWNVVGEDGMVYEFKPVVVHHPSVWIPCPEGRSGCLVIHWSKETWGLRWELVAIHEGE